MSLSHLDRIELPSSEDELDAVVARPCPETVETLRRFPGDALVLGAGGKMGLHLCLMLKEAREATGSKDTVFAASRFRSVNDRKRFEDRGIATCVGDIRDREFLDTLPNCPTVFYLVGAKFGTAGNQDLLKEINVEAPRLVADRFAGSRIVALSTGCVYAYVTPSSGGSTEESSLEPTGDYARSCLGREQQFRAVSEKTGTKVALIRLNYASELRYGILVDIAQRVFEGEPVPLAMGWVNVIWQGDALNQIVRSLDFAESPPRAINVAGKEILSVRDIAEGFAERFGVSTRFDGREGPDAWLSDSSWARRHLGEPSVSLTAMMDWIAAWLKRGGSTLGKPTGFERRDGNF